MSDIDLLVSRALAREVGAESMAGASATIVRDTERLVRQRRALLLWDKPAADALAADATAERGVGYIDSGDDGEGLVDLVIVPTAALTAHDTNNATITIRKKDSAGGSSTSVATITTTVASGSWVAFAPKAMVLTATAADLRIAAGSSISVQITKNGAGVVVPISSFYVILQRL